MTTAREDSGGVLATKRGSRISDSPYEFRGGGTDGGADEHQLLGGVEGLNSSAQISLTKIESMSRLDKGCAFGGRHKAIQIRSTHTPGDDGVDLFLRVRLRRCARRQRCLLRQGIQVCARLPKGVLDRIS